MPEAGSWTQLFYGPAPDGTVRWHAEPGSFIDRALALAHECGFGEGEPEADPLERMSQVLGPSRCTVTLAQ